MVDFSLKHFPEPRHKNFSKFSPAPTRFSGNNFELRQMGSTEQI